MSRMPLPEPPFLDDSDADADLDAWTLDELDDFADERSLGLLAAHDAEH